ncbi:MAG: hypothetical protein COV59_02210 [Candidatus Magasanikbacteria bacterium CG11_big_fil_rev_8_21_14_0_20_39_34]|uniref:Uncharacterized protein n=1 Tax=Candidatus Magasanikbacteria bacterium CG11_big_fil_rev_8_21_14_0_20_39_34 TaxID=1974653 RepID=A0A2H0N784_9BACT|nr:MAG: hypothetical protein COV59_02210 [Candidatus Magasanikbacteria bacterium CG11_big_fil_rev_8_21_14_0_20_39_34]
MKQSAWYIFWVALITLIGILLFQLGNCFGEHGSDIKNFCTSSRLVYYLWRYPLGSIFLFFVAPLFAVLAQFKIFLIFEKKRSLIFSYVFSPFPIILYGILFLMLVYYRNSQNMAHELDLSRILWWICGTFVIGFFSIIVYRLLFSQKKKIVSNK